MTTNDNLAIKGADEYVETMIVNDKLVNVFKNEFGQCYWFQWAEDGEIKSITCGTQIVDYKQEIQDYFK